MSKISEICADSHSAGRVAAEHLLERGFARFGFCGYQGRIWSDRRQTGFRRARCKPPGTPARVYEPPHRHQVLPWDREQASLTAWLLSLAKPVGIMACNDIRGRQVIEACLQAGLRVPDDVAVVGVDEDRLLCELANPPMSSVVLNLERAGYQAAELLDGLMAGRVQGPQRILVEAMWVIPRRSTDCPGDRRPARCGRRPLHPRPLPSGHYRSRRRFGLGHFAAQPGNPLPASSRPLDPPANPTRAAGLEQAAIGRDEPLGREDRPDLRLQQPELLEQRLSSRAGHDADRLPPAITKSVNRRRHGEGGTRKPGQDLSRRRAGRRRARFDRRRRRISRARRPLGLRARAPRCA